MTVEEDQLLEITNDGGLKTVFKDISLPIFWIKVMAGHPEFANTMLKTLLPFPTSNLCEVGFSAGDSTKTRQSSRLNISNTHFGCLPLPSDGSVSLQRNKLRAPIYFTLRTVFDVIISHVVGAMC